MPQLDTRAGRNVHIRCIRLLHDNDSRSARVWQSRQSYRHRKGRSQWNHRVHSTLRSARVKVLGLYVKKITLLL